MENVSSAGNSIVHTHHTDPLFLESLDDYYFYCDKKVPLLFCDNETNNARIFGTKNTNPYVKDGINNYIVSQDDKAVNPSEQGTKVASHYVLNVPASGSQTVCLRLSRLSPQQLAEPFAGFRDVFQERLQEADEFYNSIMPPTVQADVEQARVFRQALAGMLWSKQYFYYDVDQWLRDHNVNFWKQSERIVRNSGWYHMYNEDIISMPDKWEYPWYAAWDLAFHTVPLSMVDIDFAKQQLDLMLRNDYQHPNGQLPAYEWNFGDVNPPVHAYATMQVYLHDKERRQGKGDIDFLKYAFAKLMVNF